MTILYFLFAGVILDLNGELIDLGDQISLTYERDVDLITIKGDYLFADGFDGE